MPKGPEKGQGRAVQNRLIIILEATPKPEVTWNKVEDRRRKEKEEQPINSNSNLIANNVTANNTTANNQPLNNNNKGSTGDVIQDILKCSKDEHCKVLGISKSYTNLYEKEKAIEKAT